MRLLLICLLAAFISGCGTTTPAPVSHRDLSPNTERKKIRKGGSYRVVAGDTLYSIAWRAGLDYRTIAKWNDIHPPYKIYVGQRVSLAPPANKRVASKPSSQRSKSSGRRSSKQAARSRAQPSRPSTPSRASTRPKSKTAVAPSKRSVSSGKLKWHWPTRGALLQTFSGSDRTRQGIRIGGRYGQAVLAAADGRIVYIGSGLKGYGRLIIIKHNNNFLSAYGHNRKILVREDDQVAGGEKIAEMGRSAGGKPMLHFEIRRKGSPVNPVALLPNVN